VGDVFLLEGGPRAGQLVDDLPSGYSTLPSPDEDVTIVIGQEFEADRAFWFPDDILFL
jgi:hypothetical protein